VGDQSEVNGKTVLITGGAGGIGLEFSQLFAGDGYRVVAVGVLQSELDELQASFAATYPSVEVLTLQMDLATLGAASRLYQWCEEEQLVIDVLVNNVGFGLFGDHVDLDSERLESMLLLNNMLLTQLTALFGGDMKTRGQGRILNVASLAGFMPMPLFGAYSASKAYVISLSASLARELKPHGVTVSCLCPSTTKTSFLSTAQTGSSSASGASDFVAKHMATPAQVALAGYRGLQQGRLIFLPTRWLRAQSIFLGLMPRRAVTRYVSWRSQA